MHMVRHHARVAEVIPLSVKEPQCVRDRLRNARVPEPAFPTTGIETSLDPLRIEFEKPLLHLRVVTGQPGLACALARRVSRSC